MAKQNQQHEEAFDFLTSTAYPAVKFEKVGDSVQGIILDARKQQQRDVNGEMKTWDDGNPQYQIVMTIQTPIMSTEDDAIRSLYIKSHLLTAMRNALKDAGIKDSASLIGSTVFVRFAEEGRAKPRQSPPKLFEVSITPVSPF